MVTQPATSATGRPRRWWLALLLNGFAPPTGYAYVGAWRAVWLTVGLFAVGALAILEITYRWPPGTYAFGPTGILVGAAVLGLLFGLHAAWLAHRAPPRTGVSRAVTYIVPWILITILSMILRAYGPRPTYEMASESMAPTLGGGDIVMLDHPRASCGEAQVMPGDVVRFQRNGVDYIHRAIAGPGQRVMLSSGQLFIDGKPVGRRELGQQTVAVAAGLPGRPAAVIEETLADGAVYRTLDMGPDGPLDNVAEVTVPAGSWYILGDNRDNAADSRVDGPIPTSSICAVVDRIVWSKDPARIGQDP